MIEIILSEQQYTLDNTSLSAILTPKSRVLFLNLQMEVVMPNTPSTSVIRFAALWAKFPNMDAKTYIEIPTAKRIQSLKDLLKWVEKLNMSELAAQAFISIEISNDRLPVLTQKLIAFYKIDEDPTGLHFFLQEPIIALVETLVVRPPVISPTDSDKIETIELQILDIEERADTAPGIVIEASQGRDIASDRQWWSDKDLPGSVLGHLSIEIFSDTLVPKVQQCLTDMEFGDPEGLEEYIQAPALVIAKKLFTA